MEIKSTIRVYTFYLSILLAGGVFGCASRHISSVDLRQDSLVLTQRQILKEYAFCYCLMKVNKENFENDMSMSYYMELSLHGQSAMQYVEALVETFASQIKPSAYPDYLGKKAGVYHCMEFYKGQTLDSVIKTLDKEIMR